MGAPAKTPTEIDQALTVLAYYGGNASRASEELGIPRSTLTLWRRHTHRDRYLEIAEREAPRLEALAAQQAREVILRAGDVEHSLIDRLNERLADDETSSKELSEIAGTLQRVTTSKGINGTKLMELTGRPTQIVEHRDPKQAAEHLARRLGVTINGTATEIPNDTPDVPLITETVDANARDRSVSSSVD